MKISPIDWKAGDCVRVRSGVKDPDFDTDLGGWQGRVIAIQPYLWGQQVVRLQWDSLSLQQMPESDILQSQERCLDWTRMGLFIDNVEPAEARDTQADVDRVIKKLMALYAWEDSGIQGQRSQQVLKRLNLAEDLTVFEAWRVYMKSI